MFKISNGAHDADAALLAALDRSMAVIEFTPGGIVISANANFCRVMGYSAEEIIGRHHSMFVDADYAASADYKEFWNALARGEPQIKEFARLAKNGKDVFIEASYNPVIDKKGRVVRVVKTASDTTAARLRNAEFESKLIAVSRVQAIIEFSPDGQVLDANENFLKASGYALNEIVGHHHRMFVEPAYAASSDYSAFWDKLNKGEPIIDTFRRVGKNGKKILLQASYNPVFDLRGRVAKIVKFGTDFSDLATFGASMARLANNDFCQGLDEPFQAMFEPLRRDFNAVRETLSTTLSAIAQTVSLVATGSDEIASASDDLARRTEQQAASLEETVAALGEVAGAVRRAAAGADGARAVASDAGVEAARGGKVVEQAVAAMRRIETSSEQVAQIIGVIDEIAFQTNLLALNAGVEAARAGEAGRGFAVVASEVRALAQRSAQAAKEIKQLISASSKEVEDGAGLVVETGEALAGIISKVERINQLIVAIAKDSNDQSVAIHQVNDAVSAMDKAVQQNAAMAEETNAAGRSLMHNAEELARSVSVFRLAKTAQAKTCASDRSRSAPVQEFTPALRAAG